MEDVYDPFAPLDLPPFQPIPVWRFEKEDCDRKVWYDLGWIRAVRLDDLWPGSLS